MPAGKRAKFTVATVFTGELPERSTVNGTVPEGPISWNAADGDPASAAPLRAHERFVRHLEAAAASGDPDPAIGGDVLAAMMGVPEAMTVELDRLVESADAERARLSAVLADIARDLPPLRGVIHAAMVLDDCLLMNLSGERLNRVLQPKMHGAWNLHQQTLGLPIDFFICYSSMSSVFGVFGQGNYAAANMFLDELAHYRHKLGLPALTINWGYLGEVGYLSRNEKIGERFAGWGAIPLSPSEALNSLGRLIAVFRSLATSGATP